LHYLTLVFLTPEKKNYPRHICPEKAHNNNQCG
jgi:hypothetical protein